MIAYLFALVAALVATLALTPAVRWIAARLDISRSPRRLPQTAKTARPAAGWRGGVGRDGGSAWRSSASLVFAHREPAGRRPAGRGLAGRLWPSSASATTSTGCALVGNCWARCWRCCRSCCRAAHWNESPAGGLSLDLGMLAVPATLFWLVLGINSLNLLDGMDGMASSSAPASPPRLSPSPPWSAPEESFSSCCRWPERWLGFLAFNFPPARIYFGDAGSMAIGLALALASLIAGANESMARFDLTILIAVMAIPMADTTLAVVRRSLSGRGFWHPDRAHISTTGLLDQRAATASRF